MTPAEEIYFYEPLILKDFASTYFAPRRSVLAFDWIHPSVGGLVDLKTSLIGQFDMNSGRFSPDVYHSQYFVMKAGIPVGDLLFEAGGSIGTSQSGYVDEGTSFNNISLAGEAAVHYTLPSRSLSIVSLIGRHATGISNEENNSFDMFVPITSKYLGEILQIKFSGVTAISVDFTSRLHESLGVTFSTTYFIRGNNVISEFIYPESENTNYDGKLLGPEVFSRLIWSPFSDLSFNLGGGLFTPAYGNYWKNGKPIWRIELTSSFGLR
jgi:hypothetical protein